jgi:hypothetical protein
MHCGMVGIGLLHLCGEGKRPGVRQWTRASIRAAMMVTTRWSPIDGAETASPDLVCHEGLQPWTASEGRMLRFRDARAAITR